MINSPSLKNILLVEDLPSYQDLMSIAFEENNILHHLHIVNSAEEALLFLSQRQQYHNAPRPDLIMLDLDLPGMHGHELLKIIKEDHKIKYIPVIVLSTSNEPKDIQQSYALKANCYISKPYDLENFLEVVKESLNFWLNCSQIAQVHLK
ncbi:response regulator receiver protein [Stanieria cyanosphaera PCC 7437]|uniref:Response regulator receiver protein n=1 Tax=Stanieria cyanosphaera (strain ATCC 29371 / PCC 7437) TaxID=111780 RepID=K9XYJ7_STAC7|nr:response regulator [Stanieria cyanosphaera]AFZ37201.1 response regulator receiver protein [Stanieria cyanosphaera PCC 7437]